ncbi:hypothetical protein JHK85_027083 [Glycine max]|nr:hypothetical protein JHK85_027083 [Glycine max]KAG5014329.1 hypothetical protein JHK86_026590 [Glycine max]
MDTKRQRDEGFGGIFWYMIVVSGYLVSGVVVVLPLIFLRSSSFAIQKGLSIAKSKGYLDIICELDSKSAINLVKDGVPESHPYATLVEDI